MANLLLILHYYFLAWVADLSNDFYSLYCKYSGHLYTAGYYIDSTLEPVALISLNAVQHASSQHSSCSAGSQQGKAKNNTVALCITVLAQVSLHLL